MRPSTSPKLSQSHLRQVLTIPRKEIKIRTFFNQKVKNPPPNQVYMHCSNYSYRNPIDATLKQSVHFITPQTSFYNSSKPLNGPSKAR